MQKKGDWLYRIELVREMIQKDGPIAYAREQIKNAAEGKFVYLDLSSCGLKDLEKEVPELFELVWLEELNLGASASWGYLRNLHQTFLARIGTRNSIAKYPTSFRKLTKLKKFGLNGMPIETDFCRKVFVDIPTIECLDVHDTGITDKHIELLDNLANLKELYIYNNKISHKGAEVIAKLQKLKELYLSNNELGDSGARKIIGKLFELTFLHLGANKISDDGIVGIDKLSKLVELYLNENFLRGYCFGDLGKLKNLKLLDVTHNQITTIKPFLPLITPPKNMLINDTSGWEPLGLLTWHNPITEPPEEVVKQGNRAILNYFASKEREAKVNLKQFINREVKLVLVGNSSAGKSTLVKYLTSKVVDRNLPSTHWLDIKDWPFPFDGNSNIDNIRIFDFGGQEYYHDTHYLFFTKNTVYILLWDKENNAFHINSTKQNSLVDKKFREVNLQCFPLEYWLEAISYFTRPKEKEQEDNSVSMESDSPIYGKSLKGQIETGYNWHNVIKKSISFDENYQQSKPPVLLVQNKLDIGRPDKLPLQEYDDKYKNISIYDAMAISLHEERFLNNLLVTLEETIAETEILGGEFLGTYGIIRDKLKNYDGEISLNIKTFKDKCNEWIMSIGDEVGKNYSSLKFDLMDTRICSQVFSWLGYMLYYPDSEQLKDRVYVNQKLITESVQKILINLEATQGEFSKQQAKKASELSEDQLHDILLLMEHFRIIFRHPDSTSKKDTYIAPLYLPETPIKGIGFFLESFQQPLYRVAYSGFIHKSVVLHFFQEYGQYVLRETKLHHQDVFYFWRKGIVVRKATSKEEDELVLIQFYDGKDETNEKGDRIRENAHIDLYALKASDSGELVNEIRQKLREINKGWEVEEMVTADGVCFVPLKVIHEHEDNNQFVFQYDNQQLELSHFKQHLKKQFPMKKVFISYSKTDDHYRLELEKHLSVLKRNGHIATWHDRKLLPGEKWDGKIKQELKEADILLFLVSSDFLDTDYIWDIEMKLALERDENPHDIVAIVPIILRPCDWQDSPLGKFNSPVKGSDISTAADKDTALFNIVKELKEIIKP